LVGSGIALQLLFNIPLAVGVSITALDVFVVLFLQNKGFRYIEALVITIIGIVDGCFVAELIFAQPDLGGILGGYVPSRSSTKSRSIVYCDRHFRHDGDAPQSLSTLVDRSNSRLARHPRKEARGD
jgi:manganese transport protein